MDKLRDRLEGIDFFLETQNLRLRERQVLLKARKAVTAEIEGKMAKALKKRMWKEMGERNPNLFMGEKLTGAPRNIPGSTGEVEILPEETPSTYIKDFIPNRARTRDRMIIRPERLGPRTHRV